MIRPKNKTVAFKNRFRKNLEFKLEKIFEIKKKVRWKEIRRGRNDSVAYFSHFGAPIFPLLTKVSLSKIHVVMLAIYLSAPRQAQPFI